ncbi:sporangiospore maturation cell wall hydrolase GsmA [Allorhizocola rhizosphaerae]|uniref:sporangiospore maturation cell wall hydrolase GsmA n=1 Tax=Allorhizocola rhizosphaerae TaxID=1872709 RepID=UPI0013C3131E|nr:sporangiospore maturation cell wall hydrolase GsmA [Allorhizocola rhizosphaerae]
MRLIAGALATLLTLGTPATKIDVDGPQLNIRSGPGTDKSVVGEVGDEAAITVVCQVWGEEIDGTQRKSAYWDRIASGQYVSDGYVVWEPSRPVVPWCGANADAVSAAVTADQLNVRSGPGTEHGVVSTLPNGATVDATCLAWGPHSVGTVWLQLTDGNYVSGAYINWTPEKPWLPWCGQAPPLVTSGGTSGFIGASVGPAQRTMRDYRVPASVSIAQAILESGWGRSTLTRDDHNYFGKKCFGDPGPVGIGCRDYATHECSGRDCWATHDDFRAYRNPDDSYVDHGKQLSELPRYAEAMQHTGDPDRFAREIHKAGYATGATYSDKLIELMQQYDLYQYDKLP